MRDQLFLFSRETRIQLIILREPCFEILIIFVIREK